VIRHVGARPARTVMSHVIRAAQQNRQAVFATNSATGPSAVARRRSSPESDSPLLAGFDTSRFQAVFSPHVSFAAHRPAALDDCTSYFLRILRAPFEFCQRVVFQGIQTTETHQTIRKRRDLTNQLTSG
jgi:hypothetical protein